MRVPASENTHKLTHAHAARSHSHSHHRLRKKEYWKYALRNSGEEVGFSHFHPRLADVFLRERVEQCRPGHFIITVRKHSMKLSQGSKGGCLHNIPLLLLSKLALFYILQLKALFPFTLRSLPFCLIRTLRCFFVLSDHACIYWLVSVLHVKSSMWKGAAPDVQILRRSNRV